MTIVSKAFSLSQRKLTKGDLGVEIEVEGFRLPERVDGWNVTRDGSLREEAGGMALEYVFNGPVGIEETVERLSFLQKALKNKRSDVVDSPNCGVHVHVNCQDLTITQLYNFVTLYLVHEHMLTRFCGPTREGNLFCLRAEDAEYLLYELEQALLDGEFRGHFSNDRLRYSGMNLCSLSSYGSLEFRSMRGSTDPELIEQWCRLLLCLREKAKEFDSPRGILEQVSMGGEIAMVLNTFGEAGRFLTQYEGWEKEIYRGVRRCQDFAYAGDWEALSQAPKRTVGGVTVPQSFTDDFPPEDV